jgi:hypothetical protein
MSRSTHPDSPGDGGTPGEDGPGRRGPESPASRVTPAGIGEQFAAGMALDAAGSGPALAKALAITQTGLAGAQR